MADKVTSRSPIVEFPKGAKIIQINSRKSQIILVKLINSREPYVVGQLKKTWAGLITKKQSREFAKYGQDHSGRIDPDLQKIIIDYVKSILADGGLIEKQWTHAIAVGADDIMKAISKKMKVDFYPTPIEKRREGWIPQFEEDFPRMAARMDAAIIDRREILSKRLTAQQLQSTQRAIQWGFVEEGLSTDRIAAEIERSIGLTDPQMDAVINFESRLAEAGKLSKSAISKAVDRYVLNSRALRARTIARTELSYMFNRGHYEGVQEAINEGYLKNPVVKKWYTSQDERVCVFCGNLHGETVGFKNEWEIQSGNITYTPMYPPAHANCRCAVIYETT